MKQIFLVALLLVGIGLQAQQYLNNTQNYELYRYKYEKASKTATVGAVLTGTGVGVFIISNVLLLGVETDAYGNLKDNDPMVVTAGFGLMYSFVAFNVGMPLWMSGLAKKKANKREMVRRSYKPGIKEISLGTTNHGVGCIVKL